MKIDTIHPMYDPLMYVLMFPFGDKGFSIDAHPLTRKPSECCSAMQYYKYRLMPQSGESFNTTHRMDRLFQQYVVDKYAKIESSRLQYLRFNQGQLHADLYQGLADAVVSSDGQPNGSLLGKKSYPSFIFYRQSKIPASVVPRCNGYCSMLWKT